MPVSVRVRFEVFKRDSFQCRYCGKTSPSVVLEVDHVVPICEGGSDDPMNLVTSCWDCNHGKAGVLLSDVLCGEDPHDRAVLLLETERQLREYNAVLEELRLKREDTADELLDWWCERVGSNGVRDRHFSWLRNELRNTAAEIIRDAMQVAIDNQKTTDWRYVMAVIRNRKQQAHG